MPSWTGFFNSDGAPVVKIWVFGAWEQPKQEFEAVVDTGFSGFLSIPFEKAFPLALVLFGTTSVVLADGSTQPRLTAWGNIRVGSEKQHGIIILEVATDQLLVGMEFLRSFKKTLRLSPEKQLVELEDDSP